MMRTSAGNLTANDFHPEGFINPRDVFPGKGRQPSRNGGVNKAALSGNQASSLQPTPTNGNRTHACYGEEHAESCLDLDECATPSVDVCEGDCDQCDDCRKDHNNCEHGLIECVENCNDCTDEHDAACGQHGPVCTEECNDDCDLACFDCIDWNVFEKDKSLGLSYTVPILEEPGPMANSPLDFAASCDLLGMDLSNPIPDTPIPPVDMSMHHYCISNQLPPWNSFSPPTYCTPGDLTFNKAFSGSTMADFQTPWGCHPAAAHRPPENVETQTTMNQPLSILDMGPASSSKVEEHMAQPNLPQASSSEVSPDRICEWLMPCGRVCGAAFATTADLKKHLKAIHTFKGTSSCGWQGCCATFASDAALTGHISKKHLSAAIADEDGPFKCTFAGCSKSFMYKQVRDEHVASSHNGSKMFCEICKQWLNAEGSNFKRHMASHQPKHQHMLCKFHHLGCKRRFPRLDNLRRHEACCKFGKKAAMHHHHHHRHISHR